MNDDTPDMSTDSAWEEWGRRDPYFGVITNPKFRRSQMSPETLREFFQSGRAHVDFVMEFIRRQVDPTFAPKTILDFGCGVGRTLLPFAAYAERVVGMDVSASMLQEAARNRDEQKLTNVELLVSDDSLSSLTGTYDLIHSFIVFQHIPRNRGLAIFAKLLEHLGPNGIGAIQLTYAKSYHGATYGLAPDSAASVASLPMPLSEGADPLMQMNSYHLNELFFLIQRAGVHRVRAEYTNHGGELGVFLFFHKPAESKAPVF